MPIDNSIDGGFPSDTFDGDPSLMVHQRTSTWRLVVWSVRRNDPIFIILVGKIKASILQKGSESEHTEHLLVQFPCSAWQQIDWMNGFWDGFPAGSPKKNLTQIAVYRPTDP